MSKNETIFSKLTGLTTNHSTENGSFFLTFNTVQNALDSFNYLRQNYSEVRVKFARYQIFFTISGLNSSSDYSIVKQNITNFVEKEADANVLYFKLYRKGDKYLGCGDFTIDTKDAMDKLLKKEVEFHDERVRKYQFGYTQFDTSITDQFSRISEYLYEITKNITNYFLSKNNKTNNFPDISFEIQILKLANFYFDNTQKYTDFSIKFPEDFSKILNESELQLMRVAVNSNLGVML
jgi:hypothetical protein